MEPRAFEKGNAMVLKRTRDYKWRGYFGGKHTPKAVMVDLCVHPIDRNSPLAVGAMTCRTYRGRITKPERQRVLEALVQAQAKTAYGWFPYYGWFVVTTTRY